jgi:hypothetical protein
VGGPLLVFSFFLTSAENAHDASSLNLLFSESILLTGFFGNTCGKAPRRVESSVKHHITHNTHHIAGYAISVGTLCRWDDNSSSEDSVENSKCCFEVVAFGDDIVHPIRNGYMDVRKLCSSVKQQLSTFRLVVVDGRSKSSTTIIIHEVKLSAGNEEYLSSSGERLRN